MGLPGLCLLLLAAAPAPEGEQLTIEAVARLQGLVGTNVGVYSATAGTAVQLEPGVIVRESNKNALLTLEYIPWLLYTPLEPNQLLVLNRFRAAMEGRFSPRSGMSLSGIVWWGDQSYSPVVNVSYLSGPTVPTFPGSLPPVTVLKVIYATTRLGFYWLASRELRLDFSTGYDYTEGATPEARLTLPLQRGPLAEVKGTFGLTKADDLVAYVRVGLLAFGPIFRSVGSPSPGGGTVPVQNFETDLTITASEFSLRWLHRLSSSINTELSAGVGVVHESTASLVAVPGGQTGQLFAQTSVYPVAEAKLRDQLSIDQHGLVLTAAVALLPTLDQFTAIVQERLQALLSAGYALSAHWRLETLLAGTLSLNPHQLYIQGEFQAVWQPDVHVALAAGARIGYVDYYTPTELNGWSWVLYLGVTAGTGATR